MFASCVRRVECRKICHGMMKYARLFTAYRAICAGKVHPAVTELLNDLMAIMLHKDDSGSNLRPIMMGEAERRSILSCGAHQNRAAFNAFFTSPTPGIVRAHASRLEEAEHDHDAARHDAAGLAADCPAHARATASAALAAAVRALKLARQRPRHPSN